MSKTEGGPDEEPNQKESQYRHQRSRDTAQNNWLRIPDPYGTISLHWERVGKAKLVTRMIWGRTISFYVQPTRADCVHACTVDDITRLLSLVPRTDCQGLDVFVLRQSTRKEGLLKSVWGRLAYEADLTE